MPKAKVKTVSLKKLTAYNLSQVGLSNEKVGQIMGINERTVRRHRREVEAILLTSKEWNVAMIQVKGMLLKATKVYNTYLDGNGEAIGGDERCATKILEGAFLLKPQEAAVRIEANISAYLMNITVKPKENKEFAQKIVEHVKGLKNILRESASS